MKRAMQLCALTVLAAVALSCGGNSTLNETEAVVFLTAQVKEYNPDVSIASTSDVTISKLTIDSHPKDPSATLTSTQDVHLTRWQVTPYRTDGGTTASPMWQHDLNVYVAAGGSADLENYRVFPAEYFRQAPLSYLLPENGGFDPETGNTNIRQSLKVEIFGTTVSGKSISVVFEVAFNFFY
jgi:hypothetical protein